ncbi:hypothetical protein FVE85_2724 [Porphyridium purpureum]|uniref:Uncharacterized protein n=1 Tax=Porphyridium purpureum TaxID=35688 RepID=A0A5J4YUP2_PORPP|nr:hypothetical protein FVE85_2724 [Porphyridium purpureum]|eukprot:POR9511..scf227_4
MYDERVRVSQGTEPFYRHVLRPVLSPGVPPLYGQGSRPYDEPVEWPYERWPAPVQAQDYAVPFASTRAPMYAPVRARALHEVPDETALWEALQRQEYDPHARTYVRSPGTWHEAGASSHMPPGGWPQPARAPAAYERSFGYDRPPRYERPWPAQRVHENPVGYDSSSFPLRFRVHDVPTGYERQHLPPLHTDPTDEQMYINPEHEPEAYDPASWSLH